MAKKRKDAEGKPEEVRLYTDGACSGNPGPGGWAYILHHPATDTWREVAGGSIRTTNNRMELRAVLNGLAAVKRPCRVTVFTDSQYVANGAREWLAAWKVRGWRTAGKKPVKNADLWRALDKLLAKHEVTFQYVRAHSGHRLNEACDRMAVDALKQAHDKGEPADLDPAA
jgi:ribonuclease HI